jgi:hypothetical protein
MSLFRKGSAQRKGLWIASFLLCRRANLLMTDLLRINFSKFNVCSQTDLPEWIELLFYSIQPIAKPN